MDDTSTARFWKNADKYKPPLDVVLVRTRSGKEMVGIYAHGWLVADSLDEKVHDPDPDDEVAWWREI